MDIEPNSSNGSYCPGILENNDERKGTLLSSCVTLFCTTMGVGIVCCAYGFSKTGYVFGSMLFCLCCFCSALGSHLLSCCILTCGSFPSSFYSVTHRAVKSSLLGTSYLIVAGDNVPDAIKSIIGTENYPRWLSFKYVVSAGMVAVIPLVCQKNFSILRYSSTMTTAFVAYIVVMVLLHAFGVLDPYAGKDIDRGDIFAASFAPTNVLPVLSIFVLNFTCQHNLFTVCNELQGLSLSRLNSIILITMGFCLLSYLILSFGVYWTFGAATLPDFLRNYSLESPFVGFARIGFSISMLMGYPLQVLPCRRSVISLVQAIQIWWLRKFPSISKKAVEYPVMEMNELMYGHNNKEMVRSTEEESHDFLLEKELTGPELLVGRVVPTISPDSAGLVLFSAVTVCIVVLSYTIAVLGSNLRLVLEFTGAIGSTSITYIIPGFLYMRLHTAWDLRKFGALFLLTAGYFIVPTCIVFIILGGGYMK